MSAVGEPLDDTMIVTIAHPQPPSAGLLRLWDPPAAGLGGSLAELGDSDITTSVRRYHGAGAKLRTGSWGDPHTAALEPRILPVYATRSKLGRATR